MWTLWIGIEEALVQANNESGLRALRHLRTGIPLRTKGGLQLQAIKAKNGTVIGYGLVHKQLHKGEEIALTDTQLRGLTESITEAFARYDVSGPVTICTGYTESPLLPVTP
jgi:hypothetical protein